MSICFDAVQDGPSLRYTLSRWIDGDMGPDALAELETTLRESKEARQVYMAFMTDNAGIDGEVATWNYLRQTIPTGLAHCHEALLTLPPPRGVRRRSSSSRLAAWAGVLTAGIAAVAATFFWALNPPTPPLRAEVPIENMRQVIARVTTESPECEWSFDEVTSTPGIEIRQGDVLRVARGRVTFTYPNDTTVTLHGPALFEVISPMLGKAMLGKLTARIAPGGEGYSVLTPRATVIDLGTEFGIEVDGVGATDVVVFEGAVDLSYKMANGGTELQKRLTTGEALHLDAFGTASRIVSINNRRFSAIDDMVDGESSTRAPIISSVKDNIQRDSAWNYYEIVWTGMREDANAYVDRHSHEWNGIDASGMPKYLIGGDYVKTFNNDKCRTDVEIVVTLESPCKLYVLFDDRIPPPGWLKRNFRDTGDSIGVDGGPWMYNGVASTNSVSAVGPGNSIDDIMSIWVREIDAPGPVRLGPTHTPHDDLNMYGIVAVPIED